MNIRRILFRGKTFSNDEWKPDQWVYGYLVYCASEYDDPEKDRVADIIELDADRIYLGEYRCLDAFKVRPETVSQWTGLVDLHDHKIFEGDVVKYLDLVWSVWWYAGHASYLLKHNDPISSLPYFHAGEFNNDDLEVIGNIWDNPELVGE